LSQEKNVMDNTNNKEYWNNYVSYWENKVKEANVNRNAKDKTNDDVILETYFRKLNVKSTDIMLDYGCGSGRLYSIYKKMINDTADNYFGIDISGICLNHAQRENEGLEMDKNLKEFDGIHIPFDNNTFDKIICFGVFDACNQEMVIRELFRVLKTGGNLLLTGKNNRYYANDKEAAIAEINARKKGHPNYFTDVRNLKEQLLKHNVKMIENYYFLRRGDFPQNQVVYEMPEIFYEWAFLLEKLHQYKDYEYSKFSDSFSVIGELKRN